MMLQGYAKPRTLRVWASFDIEKCANLPACMQSRRRLINSVAMSDLLGRFDGSLQCLRHEPKVRLMNDRSTEKAVSAVDGGPMIKT